MEDTAQIHVGCFNVSRDVAPLPVFPGKTTTYELLDANGVFFPKRLIATVETRNSVHILDQPLARGLGQDGPGPHRDEAARFGRTVGQHLVSRGILSYELSEDRTLASGYSAGTGDSVAYREGINAEINSSQGL